MKEISKEGVMETLQKIIHPTHGKSITELEMISDVSVEGKTIHFTLLVQRMGNEPIEQIKQLCLKAIKGNFGLETDVVIKTAFKKTENAEEAFDGLKNVRNIIAVASGKGGVGKSTIASNLAVALAQYGAKTGLLDADIFGPSVPKMFQSENTRPNMKRIGSTDVITPLEKYGVKLQSIGFFVNPEDALVWRGPMATSALKQLLTQTDWSHLDYLCIDMPPGTSDVHLTLVQTLAVTGVIIVSTPQQVALADAIKGINMFKGAQINVPVLGLIENMAWFTPAELPQNKYYLFGKEGCKALAEKLNVPLLGQIPLVQSICECGDQGKPSALYEDSVSGIAFKELAIKVIEAVEKRNKEMGPTKKVNIN